MKHEDLVDFRGVKIARYESDILKAIENYIEESCKGFGVYDSFHEFELVEKVDDDLIWGERGALFMVENNHVVTLIILETKDCDFCHERAYNYDPDPEYANDYYDYVEDYYFKNCRHCGLFTLPESINNLKSLRELYIIGTGEDFKLPRSIFAKQNLKIYIFTRSGFDYYVRCLEYDNKEEIKKILLSAERDKKKEESIIRNKYLDIFNLAEKKLKSKNWREGINLFEQALRVSKMEGWKEDEKKLVGMIYNANKERERAEFLAEREIKARKRRELLESLRKRDKSKKNL